MVQMQRKLRSTNHRLLIRIHNNFIEFCHMFQKCINSWPLKSSPSSLTLYRKKRVKNIISTFLYTQSKTARKRNVNKVWKGLAQGNKQDIIKFSSHLTMLSQGIKNLRSILFACKSPSPHGS